MKLFGKPKKAGDFSEVDSMDKVMEYANQGILVPLYLMPLRFNGEDSVSNRVFVPTVVVELKDRYDDMVEDLVRKGKVDGYSCDLEYKGKSQVPSKIHIQSKKEGKPVFKETINVW